MTIRRLHLLPLLVFCWFPGTFVITYVTAVNLGDVLPIFPYISDTGTFSPESCVFGQMLNMGAVLMVLAVYVKHRQVSEANRSKGHVPNVENLNNRSLWLGLAASFGVSIVGNFQETNVFTIHVLGALLAFGLGTVYVCVQTKVSFRLSPGAEHRRTNFTRAALCFICVVGFAVCFLAAAISMMEFKGKDVTKWRKEDGGYDFHVASTVSEWIVAVSQMGFILTYMNDFRGVAFEEPSIFVDDGKNSTKVSPQEERF